MLLKRKEVALVLKVENWYTPFRKGGRMHRLLLGSVIAFIGVVFGEARELPSKPNIIVLMTDQERAEMHWPEGWGEKNLPARSWLKAHGLSFTRAYTATSQCSPSRAVLMTGEYYPTNRVAHLLPPVLPTAKELMNIGELLRERGGYEVVYKGKWHLTLPVEGEGNWSEKDVEVLAKEYGFSAWDPPDSGNWYKIAGEGKLEYSGLHMLGGGYANNDGRFMQGAESSNREQTKGMGESAIEFLEKVAKRGKSEERPFCLFVSLVNPHDVWVYPDLWELAGYKKEEFQNVGIMLPQNYDDTLETKPSIQKRLREVFMQKVPLKGAEEAKTYVNFYAYLHKIVDREMERLLTTLEKNGLLENTIIIHTADHGEMGLSHGLREKAYTAYEEMIRVPLIISNPKLFPVPETSSAFYSHADLLPTLAELAGIKGGEFGKGVSIVPVIKDPTTSVQDSILFSFDDHFLLPADAKGGHIRAIREGDWLYALYFSENGGDFEYELYNLLADPGEMHNLLHGYVPRAIRKEAKRLDEKLKKKVSQVKSLPENFPWPTLPF